MALPGVRRVLRRAAAAALPALAVRALRAAPGDAGPAGPGRAAAASLSVLCPLCDAEVTLPPGGLGQLAPDYTALGRGGAAGTAGRDLCIDGAAARRGQACGAHLCLFCCQAHK